MSANQTFSIWHHRIPALLIPIVLIGSLPCVTQKDAGGLEMAGNAKPVGAIEWTGLDTADPTAEEPPRLKVIFDQPTRTTANRHIVVSISDKKLYLMKSGKIIRQYNALLGDTNEPTPTGEFRITEHTLWNDSVIGKAWMGFHSNLEKDISYGIHGRGPQHDETSTFGCVALKNDDVVDLFRRVSQGDPVTIIGTPGPIPNSD